MFGTLWTRLGICALIAIGTHSAVSAESQPNSPHPPSYSRQKSTPFIEELLDLVEVCVHYDEGFRDKAALRKVILQLRTDGYIHERGNDNLRINYVSIQGMIEHVLASALAMDEIQDLVGVIHAPSPATPLCTRPCEDVSKGLLDPSIEDDMQKKLTISSRAQILRDYLHKGGHLFVAYPKKGLKKRSEEQLSIYQNLISQFPYHLHDCALDINSLDPEMIGATYLFRARNGQLYAFSTQARQANQPVDDSEWGMWIGPISNPEIAHRIHAVDEYLQLVGGPHWMNELLQSQVAP